MRESMLYDLYFGRVSPWERKRIYTPEYNALIGKIIEMEEHFKNLLSSEEYEKFGEMQDLRGQAGIIESTDLFAYSFRLGALMMMDIFGFRGTIDRTEK